MALEIALFQPDIAGNTGAILRLSACFDMSVHIIEPAGFDISDRNLKRAAMDYFAHVKLTRHINWQDFYQFTQKNNKRLIAFTTKTEKSYTDFCYQQNDILLFGRESKGLPKDVHEKANAELTIPMKKTMRSLNLAMSVAIAVSEAKRQLSLL